MGSQIAENLWQGRLVRLAGLTKEDAREMARWRNDAGFLRLLDATAARPQSEEQLAKWIEDEHKNERSYQFAIRRLRDDVLVGQTGLDSILWSHGVAWLAIEIGDRSNWGKGFGHEAMTLLLAFGFRELNLHRIQLTVFSYNERAIELYERSGFRREGIYREFLHRDGERYDMYLYGLLCEEWQAL
jgi:RimJ/RimL family protein N-acetyltransferase